jgi:hypothetical protein
VWTVSHEDEGIEEMKRTHNDEEGNAAHTKQTLCTGQLGSPFWYCLFFEHV